MKKCLFILFVISLLTGCNKLDFNENIKMPTKTTATTKFNVSLKSVNTLLGILGKNDSTKKIDKVEPIIHSGDTLLYIVNYQNNKGWKIISGDKRTANILASDNTGSFNIKDLKSNIAVWFDDLAEHIYALKLEGKADTTGVDYKLWTNIEKLQLYQNQSKGMNKVIQPAPIEEGYWELVNITSDTLPPVQIGPLIQTKWGQNYPWNTCVPFTDANNTKRCKVGCTVVAGAQVLYYFHYKTGIPANAPEEGTCFGYSTNPGGIFDRTQVFFSFGNPNSSSWNNMATSAVFDQTSEAYLGSSGTNYSAIFLGYVGESMNTRFGENGSSNYVSDLINVIRTNGIWCNWETDYNYSTVLANLANNVPVIVFANSHGLAQGFLGIYYRINDINHSWIIDGTITQTIKYTYYYQMINTGGGGGLLGPALVQPLISDYKTEESYYTSTYLTMNWGTDGESDGGQYSLTDGWPVNSYNFCYDRTMVSGFSN